LLLWKTSNPKLGTIFVGSSFRPSKLGVVVRERHGGWLPCEPIKGGE
jgi:hypothetical protein